MVALYLDVELTRRKRYHVIISERGEILYRDQYAGGCIEWLEEEGYLDYVLHTPGRSWAVHMQPRREEKEE